MAFNYKEQYGVCLLYTSTVTMNGSNVSATVGRMQLKVTADGVEINGGKQGGLVLAAALRRSRCV